MDDFLGTWRLSNSEGDQEALAAFMGIPAPMVKKMMCNSVTQEGTKQSYSKKGDKFIFKIIVDAAKRKSDMEGYAFKLGEPTVTTNVVEDEVTVTTTLENGILKQVRESDDGTVTVHNELDKNKLQQTIIYGEKSLKSLWIKC